MTNTLDKALAVARSKSHPSLFSTNTCLMQVRKCFGVDAKFPTAASAWINAKKKHVTTRAKDVPRGGIAFWTGGSSGAGHIAIGLGDGLCETTDFVNRGGFGVARIDDITRVWGLRFVGWTEDVNGVTVFTPPEPPRPVPVPRKEPAETPYDHAYDLAEQIVKELGPKVQKKYKARRRLIDGIAALLPTVPVPASRVKVAKK